MLKLSKYPPKGFTLIELLVVVLIIGILAAIALPQYKKAVWKSRASQLYIAVKSVADAEERYFLTNGNYSATFNNLDVTFDGLTGNNSLGLSSIDEGVRSNDQFTIVINQISNGDTSIVGMFVSGGYAYTGIIYPLKGSNFEKQFVCIEKMSNCLNCCPDLFKTSQTADFNDGAWNWYKL